MPAGQHTFVVEQGATFSATVTWLDESGVAVDLTGYSARMQARPSAAADYTILSLTSGAGITLGGTAGTIALLMDAADTDDLTPGRYVYDLELVSGAGTITRLLEGTLRVTAEVTR